MRAALLSLLFALAPVLANGWPARPMVPASAAPRAVQRDLARLLASCGQSATAVRRNAMFERATLAGGAFAYVFALTRPHWRARDAALPAGGACAAPVGSWIEVWAPTPSGYRRYELAYGEVAYGPAGFVLRLADPDCDLDRMNALAWWDCQHYLAWDRAKGRFVPLTPDMSAKAAMAWSGAHGYRSWD